MIQKIIDRHLEKMAKEVLRSNNPMVQRFQKETKKNGADEQTQVEAMISILTDVICAREMDPEEMLYEGIESFLDIMEMKQIYELNSFDSQTDSSWSDFDTGYQA